MIAHPQHSSRHKSAGQRSFLNEVTIQHGPANIIGRLLLAAETAARQREVFLSFAPLDELVEINRANRDTWRTLLPVFNPECGLFDSSSAFCILGRDVSGEVVLTQGARFYNWENTCFHDEATSLRLFYDDPDKWRRDGEAVEVTAPSARLIAGRVAFTGAHWCRPDFRARGLPAITPRIARALAVARWDVEYTCTIMAKDVFSRGVAQRAGYPNVEWGVHLKNNPVGTLLTAFLWNDRKGIIADLKEFLGHFAQHGIGAVQRHA